MEQTVEGVRSWGEAGRDIGQVAADYLDANSTLRTTFEAAGEGIGIAIGVGINAAGMSRGKAGSKAPKIKPTASKPKAPTVPASSSVSSSATSSVSATSSQTTQRKLLPNEGTVGTYGELFRTRVAGSNLAAHHIPNDNYMRAKGVPRNEGIAMRVEHPQSGGGRHREIHKTMAAQDINLAPRDALAESILRAREVYKNDGVYTPEIRNSLQEVIRQNKNKFPQLFKKD